MDIFSGKYINFINSQSSYIYSVPQELSVRVALDLVEILIKVLHKILIKILRDPRGSLIFHTRVEEKI